MKTPTHTTKRLSAPFVSACCCYCCRCCCRCSPAAPARTVDPQPAFPPRRILCTVTARPLLARHCASSSPRCSAHDCFPVSSAPIGKLPRLFSLLPAPSDLARHVAVRGGRGVRHPTSPPSYARNAALYEKLLPLRRAWPTTALPLSGRGCRTPGAHHTHPGPSLPCTAACVRRLKQIAVLRRAC
ncbi:hypothetical protein K458DRAFT_170936 [Lentithecium fluviatile CBS 122367]|uniref:Uncharacterized protein n=1 Tax=Lentithecium fluviatile CBS 122367 TaxID=1168545 RepID=A0A6G1JBN3_9PLEO|nr:hypothetical protein K458DRAFT_170936 [Lentithecium fluviatile CBS 122367]